MLGAQPRLFQIFFQILFLNFVLDFFYNFEFDFNVVEDLCLVWRKMFS